jgi:N-acetylglutamate synthase-like GNAT family acetyltransferase
MTSTGQRVRRATLDDIGQLTSLWRSLSLPAEELAKRITEFQLVVNETDQVLGAVGLQIAERQARIHSEAFLDFATADTLRARLWERVRAVATNHGLVRLWTQEHAPFWNHCGLVKAEAEALEKLPATWRGSPAPWLTLKLKEDVQEILSVDHEFAMFMEAEKQRTARAFQQAKVLKVVATLLAVTVLFFVIAGAFLLIRKNPQLLHR